MPNVFSPEGRPMLGSAIPSFLQQVRRLADTASSDEQLLADFLARRSDEAFAALIGRHGPMVLNVCRRILQDAHAAEDVFQATFLVLADRAGSIRRRASLAGFLHGVAYRLAVRARRPRLQSLPAAVRDDAVAAPERLAWQEMLGILDQELGRLSDRYRAPLVLCYLEGRTQDEAARQLGWGLNTLRRRLARGRRLLEVRLRGRGVTLPAALAGLLAASAAAVPGPLRAATLAAAGARAAGSSITGAPTLATARKANPLVCSPAGKLVGALMAAAALAAAVCLVYGWPPHAGPAEEGDSSSLIPPPSSLIPSADPLPAQATVRLGTARYRHGSRIASFAVSADGTLAAAAGGWGSFAPARGFDLTDGRCLYSLFRKPQSEIEAVGLSPDGNILATKDDEGLSLRDARTGEERRKVKYVPAYGGRSITDWVTFTPDGKQVAAVMKDSVHLIEVATGKTTRTFAPGAVASACVFSPDGRWMATGGYERDNGGWFARIFDVATGEEVRRFPAGHDPGGNGQKRALAFSPDGTVLAGGGWGDGRLRLWEAATGKERMVLPGIGPDVASVAFAPDGKTVAAAGERVHLYDAATGKERLRIERQARGIAFSRDGSVLTGAVSGAIYRWDAASGRQLTPAAAQDSGVEQVLVGADGRQLFTTDRDGDLYAWDPSGGKPPRRIAGGVERGVVASPDGRFLAWAVPIDAKNPDPSGQKWYQIASRVRLYDVAGGQVIDRGAGFPGQGAVVAFLPGGRTLLTLSEHPGDATVRLWDVESVRERRSFAVALTSPTKIPAAGRSNAGLPVYTARRATLSPDGKTLAVGPDWEENLSVQYDEPVRLFDVATGKAGRELSPLANGPAARDEAGTGRLDMGGLIRTNRRMLSAAGRAFSPDGRLLADWAENPYGRSRMDHVTVWDAATGRAVASLAAGPRHGTTTAAFAPDGRTFATASADGTVLLWETATWTVRAELRGHRDRVTALAFGPDGRLFTGGLDTVVLCWDVRPPRAAARGTLAEAWEALTAADGKAGYQAQGRFLAEPGKAVEWLAARLTPVHRLDPARVKELIADLGDDDFATRERATAELADHAAAAAAALREAVAHASSAEARRRAEGLLRDLENGVIPARELRALRAVEVLEWVATPAARARLRELASGDPDARLTRAAASACGRLEGRK